MQQIIKQIGLDTKFIDFCMQYVENQPQEEIRKIFLACLEDFSEFNQKLAERCLKYVNDINFGDHDSYNINPLIRMSYHGKLSAVKFLVENNADIEHLSEHKTTAIMYAFQAVHIPVVTYLLDRGAQIQVGNQKMINYHKKEHINQYFKLIEYYDQVIRSLREENKYLFNKCEAFLNNSGLTDDQHGPGPAVIKFTDNK